MIISIVLNVLIVAGVAAAIIMAVRAGSFSRNTFKYFTTLSNLFCAAASILMIVFSAAGSVPGWVLLIKYTGTCAVTVTFITVMVFLGPTKGGYKDLLFGPEFMLHLACPVLAIVSYIFFEKQPQPFWTVVFGELPVLLYGALYLYKVVIAPEEKRWEDFYGFNRGGKWPVSFAALVIGGFVISVVIRAL